MKKHFTGFSRIFSFTFSQHIRSKGYKNATIVIALLCLLLPAAIMGLVEYLDEGEAQSGGETQAADLSALSTVISVDLCDEQVLDLSALPLFVQQAGGRQLAVVDMGDDLTAAGEAAAGSDDTLILVTEQSGEGYSTSILLPDDSGLAQETADSFKIVFDQYTQGLAASLAGDKTAGSELSDPAAGAEAGAEAEDPLEGIEDIVSMVVNYLNIMLMYFFVLIYGQGVANSVVMEKSSKLIETFLVSVRPTAMILGKLLAITAAGIMQLLTWAASLAISFAAGTFIVKSMNPQTDMFIIKGFEMLKGLLDGLLSPLNVVLAILLVVAGLLMYCALAGIGGALASKTEDLSSANVIFTLILVASFLGALAGGGLDPSSQAAPLLDWIPFTAVMITPGRVLMGSLPLWKTAACLAITLLTALLAACAAGKVYRALVLYKGDVPKPKDIVRMLRKA